MNYFSPCSVQNPRFIGKLAAWIPILVPPLLLRFYIKEMSHIAGLVVVRKSVLDPIKYWNNTIVAVLKFRNAVFKESAGNFRLSSFVPILAGVRHKLLVEVDLKQQTLSFAGSNLMFEKGAQGLARSSRPLFITLRYDTVAGVDPFSLAEEKGDFFICENRMVTFVRWPLLPTGQLSSENDKSNTESRKAEGSPSNVIIIRKPSSFIFWLLYCDDLCHLISKTLQWQKLRQPNPNCCLNEQAYCIANPL